MEEVMIMLDNMNEGIKMYEEMLESGELLNEHDLADAYTMRGMLYFQMGKLDESIVDFDKGITMMEQMNRDGKQFDANGLANAYAGRGMANSIIEEFDQALADLSKSIEIWESMQDAGKPIDKGMLSKIYMMRGGARNHTYENQDEALSDYHKCIKIAEGLQKTGEPFDENDLATAYMGIGQSYDQKEEYLEANVYYNRCIGLWEKLRGNGQESVDDNNLAIAYMNRGANYTSLEQNNKALSDYNKSIGIRERLQKEGVEQDVYYTSLVYRNRALAYAIDGNIKAAINDNINALHNLKRGFSEYPDLQEMYYDTLNRVIELIIDENDQSQLDMVLQKFLYSMQRISKTEEATNAQNNILEQLRQL